MMHDKQLIVPSPYAAPLQAQGSCPKNIRLEDYAKQVLPPQVHHELLAAINNNRWLEWEHFDQVRGWVAAWRSERGVSGRERSCPPQANLLCCKRGVVGAVPLRMS
jgi:hypothetical protein